MPLTARDRSLATTTFLERTGMAGRVPVWRARGVLDRWWRAGACVAALLHAVDRHPDQPDQLRGDALRAARRPLGVLGHRLGPWAGRLDELPADRRGVDRAARLMRLSTLDLPVSPSGRREVPSSPDVRASARAQLAATLAARKLARY